MANPITIAETRDASIWNSYALTGARVGLLAVMSVVASAAVAAVMGWHPPIEGLIASLSASNLLLGASAGAAGMLVGAASYAGALSQARAIEHNRVAGRTVFPPTLFNQGMAHGLMDGLLLGAAAITVTAMMAPAAWAATALAFVGGAAMVGTAFLGYYQADAERDSMARSYMVAQQKGLEKDHGQDHSITKLLEGLSQQKSKGVTAEDMATLNARLREGAPTSAVARLEDERNHTHLSETAR